MPLNPCTCDHCNPQPASIIGQRVLPGILPASNGIIPVQGGPPGLPALPIVNSVDAEDVEDDGCVTCVNCCERNDASDSRTNDNGDVYCDGCYGDAYTCCDNCGDELDRDEGEDHYVEVYRSGYSSRTESVGPLCESCLDEKYAKCNSCGNYVRTSESSSHDGDSYCDSCFSESYGTCDGCSETFCRDDLNYSESREGDYCNSCHREDEDFEPKRFRMLDSDTFARTRSARTFGVELETSNCDGYTGMSGDVYFGAKDDGSIDGKEFVSAVLRGDRGLDAINDFCGRANRYGFEVDNKCGFHAHFGVGDLSIEELRSVALAYAYTYPIWNKFVHAKRRDNNYCGAHSWDSSDIAGLHSLDAFSNWAVNVERYQWMNVAAYAEHRTFELRIHTATLDGRKVCNWVVAHIRFIDAMAKLTPAQIRGKFAGKSAQSQFNALCRIWDDAELSDYFAQRASKFGTALYVNPADRGADRSAEQPASIGAEHTLSHARAVA